MLLLPGTGMNIQVDGQSYKVEHLFGDARALINYEGLYVFVDKRDDGVWELSGVPAREDEKPVLKALTDPMNDKTVITVTKPDE